MSSHQVSKKPKMTPQKRNVVLRRTHRIKQRYGNVKIVGKDKFAIPLQAISDRTISDPSVEFLETWPEPSKLAKATPLYPDEEVEVKNAKDTTTREIRKLRVTRVISPYRFYADYDVNHRHKGFKHWRESFQAFYNKHRHDPKWKLTSPDFVRKYRCYAHFNAEYNEWERVRVCRQNHLLKLAEVFVCDYSSFKIVKFDTLRELNPEYSKWPAYGFRLYLVHIRPIGDDILWSKEAVELFKAVTNKKSFRAVVMLRSETRFPDGFPDFYQDIGVFMVPLERGGPRSLQGELIKGGFGIATGLSGGYPDMLYPPESEPRFTLHRLYMADRSLLTSCDIRPAKQKQSMEEWENLITKVKRAVQADIDRKKPTVEEALRKLVQWPDLSKPRFSIDLSHLPKGIQHKLAYVRLCHIVNPGVMFVQLQCQIAMLKEMELAIGVLSSNCPVVSVDDNQIGLFVTTAYQTSKHAEPSWVRCIVTQVGFMGKDVIKVLVIDYGVMLTLKREYCRYLPDFFKTIPAFAHRIHVDFNDVMPYGGKSWSVEASEVFRKYIQSWDSQEPLYYIWRPGNYEPVELEDIQQIVQFNKDINMWEEGITRDDCPRPQCFKEVPILTHLYYSYGVEMVFEIVNIKRTYLFQHLTHVLLEGGFCVPRHPSTPAAASHKAIVTAMNNAYTFQRQLKINKAAKKT